MEILWYYEPVEKVLTLCLCLAIRERESVKREIALHVKRGQRKRVNGPYSIQLPLIDLSRYYRLFALFVSSIFTNN